MRRPLLVALCGALLALSGSALTGCYLDRKAAERADLPAATCTTDSDCEGLPSGEFVLVGTECGPLGETMVAREEDRFPPEGCADIHLHWLED